MSSRALRKLQDNIDIPGADEDQSEEDEVRVDTKKQKGFNAFLLVSEIKIICIENIFKTCNIAVE